MAASVVRLEALPLVDLRLLSQPELYSLVFCSSSSNPSFSSYGNDDVLIPKIDRSVFNESAGSRKQTYSRLRLAPRKPQIPEPLDEENSQIISLLKQLFAAETSPSADDDGLVPVPVEFVKFLPDSSSAGLQIVPVDVASSGPEEETRKRGRPPKNENRMIERNVECKAEPIIPINVVSGEGEKKQKRGRPRKNKNLLTESCQSEREMAAVYESAGKKYKEMEVVVVNKKGDVTGVAALGNVEDPYGEELKRRTEGLQTEADFLGFLSGLRGQWWRKSRKKRIVMASDFGHALPNGWKLMLSIKKRAGRVWLHCRRYISQLRSGHPDVNYLLGRKMDFGDDSETQGPASPGNERTFVVENNVIKVSFPSVEVQKLEIGSESGLNDKDKTSSGEDFEVKCFTSTVGDMKVDGGYTCKNSESASGFGNHDGGLKDVCTDVNTYGNHVITVGLGNNHASQNDKAVIGSKQEGEFRNLFSYFILE